MADLNIDPQTGKPKRGVLSLASMAGSAYPQALANQNDAGARGDARLDGSQNRLALMPQTTPSTTAAPPPPSLAADVVNRNDAGSRGDARLDGSQNVSLLASAVNTTATPMSAPPLASGISTAAGAMPGTQDSLYTAQKAALDRGEGLKRGGPVKGPGTPTSDSVKNVDLSNTEYVLTPQMVQALGGEAALEKLRAQTATGAKGKAGGYAAGGPVDENGDSVADWNSLAAQAKPSLRSIAASGNYPGAVAPLAPRLAAMLPSGSDAPFTNNPNFNPSQAYHGGKADAVPALAANVPAGASGSWAATPLASVASTMPNATGGQAQARKVDNPLMAAADQADQDAMNQRTDASRALVNYAAPGSGNGYGFALRDAIRGGAAPNNATGGSALGRVTPGMAFNSDYGYGDKVTATADKNGKLNSFTNLDSAGNRQAGNVGNMPGLADYSAGLQRAAAAREQLASIEAQKNALPITAQMTPQQAIATSEANTYNANVGAQTRSQAARNERDAGARPYYVADAETTMAKTKAEAAHANAQAGQAQATTALTGEQTTAAKMSNQLHTTLQSLYTKLGTVKTDGERNAIKAQVATILGKEKYMLADVPVGGTNPVTGGPNTIKAPFDAERGQFINPPPQQISKEEYIAAAKENAQFKTLSDPQLTAMYYQWQQRQK